MAAPEESTTDGAAARNATPAGPAPTLLRRLAAAGALVALLLAIALAVAGFLNDPLRLVGSLLLVLIVVMAGWTALVNRGAARGVAAGVAIVALIVLVVLLVFGSPVRLALLVGLVLISTAAARLALGHDLAHGRAEVQSVGPA